MSEPCRCYSRATPPPSSGRIKGRGGAHIRSSNSASHVSPRARGPGVGDAGSSLSVPLLTEDSGPGRGMKLLLRIQHQRQVVWTVSHAGARDTAKCLSCLSVSESHDNPPRWCHPYLTAENRCSERLDHLPELTQQVCGRTRTQTHASNRQARI